MSIQQLMLGVGAGKKKVYIDDAFSTYLYTGNNSSNQVTNGIDNTTKGLVWLKNRSTGGSGRSPMWLDTIRGGTTYLLSDSDGGQGTDGGYHINTFNNNGFTLQGNGNGSNANGDNFVSWNFKGQEGFFDVVTYTGNGSNRTIAHSLGSVPGMIIVKRTDDSADWRVYYRGSDGDNTLKLNNTASVVDSPSSWNSTKPTATHFSLGTQAETNANGGTFIAYLFAGGESPAATATSVVFSGQEGIDVPASSDLNLATSNFTIEGWVYVDNAPGTGSPSYGRFFQLDGPTVNDADTNLQITINPSGHKIYVQHGPNQLIAGNKVLHKKWNHIALTRSNNDFTIYVNGTRDGTGTTSQSFNPNSGSPRVRLGYAGDTSNNNGVFQGKISNFRITVGQVLYSSDFKVPTEPLTTTSQGATASNVKLLCCNGSTTTSATVTPGTITEGGSPAASTDSPFDDPAAFIFGENENEGIIKCGNYVGNGANAGPEIELGWEPQWVMWKRYTGSDSWYISDSMRGIFNGNSDPFLAANESTNESGGTAEGIELTSTGFKLVTTGNWINANGDEYFFIAIRRPDGYVGKPAAVGTDVFAMDTGSGSTTIPAYDSGFPVDFTMEKITGSTGNWYASTRMTGDHFLYPNLNSSESNGGGDYIYDSNVGSIKGNWTVGHNGYMWKRHKGFDVVSYIGNQTTDNAIRHNLGQPPEMIWVKNRDESLNWYVGHKGLNGGTDAWEKYIDLNLESVGGDYTVWNDKVPTSTHFWLGHENGYNGGSNMVALLFSSVDKISKVGYYTGNGSNSGPTITTGFSPRFIIIKNTTGSAYWVVFDTLSGINNSGNDSRLKLNTNAAANSLNDWLSVSSTGFTLNINDQAVNTNTHNYIYYAHA